VCGDWRLASLVRSGEVHILSVVQIWLSSRTQQKRCCLTLDARYREFGSFCLGLLRILLFKICLFVCLFVFETSSCCIAQRTLLLLLILFLNYHTLIIWGDFIWWFHTCVKCTLNKLSPSIVFPFFFPPFSNSAWWVSLCCLHIYIWQPVICRGHMQVYKFTVITGLPATANNYQ
jgi:hypothetical protein